VTPKSSTSFTYLEAKLLVDKACSIARGLQLDYLDSESIDALLDQRWHWAVSWVKVDDPGSFTMMLRDTWRRVWCHLVIVDHDVSKALRQGFMFISTVVDISVDYAALLERRKSPAKLVRSHVVRELIQGRSTGGLADQCPTRGIQFRRNRCSRRVC